MKMEDMPEKVQEIAKRSGSLTARLVYKTMQSGYDKSAGHIRTLWMLEPDRAKLQRDHWGGWMATRSAQANAKLNEITVKGEQYKQPSLTDQLIQQEHEKRKQAQASQAVKKHAGRGR